MNVGFYDTANAASRLAGAILSGVLYQWASLQVCLWASVSYVLAAGVLSLGLPADPPRNGARPKRPRDAPSTVEGVA